ncbi:MAG: DUF3027 domain-containing protein [Acidobacteria bacterium]|nr:DUF3027 domain-containing protein [Acidobacteriota bacterium]
MAVTQEERTALALAALGEVTDPDDVGELVGTDEVEPGVVDLRFVCRLSAYTGWYWTVSTSDLPDGEVTVLEVELLPGDGALLAPPWVPWTERLADWRRQHPDEDHHGEQADDLDDDADLDDDSEVDEDDLAVDDELDELDDAELEGALSPQELEHDPDEAADGGGHPDDQDQDGEGEGDLRGPRPAEVDRSI